MPAIPQRRIVSLAAIPAFTLILGACGATYDFAGLKAADMEGDGYARALAREYRVLAVYESDAMYDWDDAALYGRKAEAALAGAIPLPDSLDARRIPHSAREDLTRARARLLALAAGDNALRHPGTLAKAQASFDCWMEQQEENWQAEHIAKCRNGFMRAVSALEGDGASRLTPSTRPQTRPAALTSDVPPPRETNTLLFAFDSARLTVESQTVINRIIHEQKTKATGRLIAIEGHADRAGSDAHNMTLSRDRARAVFKALVAGGIDPNRLHLEYHGENRPAVNTLDGMRAPENRRVVIRLVPAQAL